VIVIVLCYRLYAVLLLLCCTVIVLLLLLFVLLLLLFVLSYVLIVCTVPLPPGVNPIAVDKYININKFGNNTYPRRIRRRSNLGHIVWGKKVRFMGREIW
jgi:hypothetical protein